jgi:puromycin-sensitive aminopeptidase
VVRTAIQRRTRRSVKLYCTTLAYRFRNHCHVLLLAHLFISLVASISNRLNEGFASWAENWAADRLYPEYAMWDQFTTGHLNSALRLDALKSSHPIQVPIHHAEEVDQVFDAISYCKGGSVVRMIKAVLGMKHFQEGLAAYMKKFEYGNTETFDLWNSWEEVSGVPVGEMMASWTEQMGFPLVRVLKEDWQDDKVVLELDQMWFLSDGCALDAEGAAKKWTIPILTCNEGGAQADMTLMREKTATVTIPITKGGWVKLNAGQEVPMRVLPSEEMLKRMAIAIQTKAMGPIDRAGLLNDAYALVKAGHMSPESLIQLMGNYKDEDAYIVWQGLSSVLHGLDSIVSDDEAMSASFKPFAKGIVLKLASKVGWEAQATDEHLTTLLRGMMINLLSDFAADDDEVAKEALTRFNAFLEDADDVTSLPTDMRTPVFKIVLQNGGATEYDAVKAYFYTATDSSERKHVLGSMGHTSDLKLKLSTMEWTTSGAVKLQDFFYAMGSVGHSSAEGREISWKFYQDNFEKIKLMLGKSAASLMDACVVMCAGSFSTVEKADEIAAFFEENPLPNNHRKISQLTESMRANGNFLAVLKASQLSKVEFWAAL